MLTKVVDGSDTSFWNNRWVGDACLASKFAWLYVVSLKKNVNIMGLGR